MASSRGGFNNRNQRTKKQITLIKKTNRKRNLEGCAAKKIAIKEMKNDQ